LESIAAPQTGEWKPKLIQLDTRLRFSVDLRDCGNPGRLHTRRRWESIPDVTHLVCSALPRRPWNPFRKGDRRRVATIEAPGFTNSVHPSGWNGNGAGPIFLISFDNLWSSLLDGANRYWPIDYDFYWGDIPDNTILGYTDTVQPNDWSGIGASPGISFLFLGYGRFDRLEFDIHHYDISMHIVNNGLSGLSPNSYFSLVAEGRLAVQLILDISLDIVTHLFCITGWVCLIQNISSGHPRCRALRARP
jgi:hypothetical protein